MSIISNSNFKRIITFLLVIVMIVGMMPLTASSVDTGSTIASTAQVLTGDKKPKTKPGESTGTEDPTYKMVYGRFTRYTLVRFPFSDNISSTIPASQWAGGTVVGSVDVMTEGAYPAGAEYFTVTGSNLRSNAFSYRNGDGITRKSGYSAESLFGELPAYAVAWQKEPLRLSSTETNPLMCKFGGEYTKPGLSSNEKLYAVNETFNRVLQLIVDSSSYTPATTELKADYNPSNLTVWNGINAVSASTVSGDFRYSYNFIASAEKNGSCYRLLAEPGVITNIPDGCEEAYVPAAVTLRDIASVLLTERNAITSWADYHGNSNGEYEGRIGYIGGRLGKGSWAGPNGFLNGDFCGPHSSRKLKQYWFVYLNYWFLQRHALGLFNTTNTFHTYTFTEADGKVTNVTFNEPSVNSAFFPGVSVEKAIDFLAVWNFSDHYAYKYSDYSIAQFVLMSYKPKTGTVFGGVYWQDDSNRDGERADFDKWRLTALNFFAIQREHGHLQETSTAMSILRPIFSLFMAYYVP